jgi:hypothetical protein
VVEYLPSKYEALWVQTLLLLQKNQNQKQNLAQ